MSFQRLWSFFSSSRTAKSRVPRGHRTPRCEQLEDRRLLYGDGVLPEFSAGELEFEMAPQPQLSVEEIQAAEIERAFQRVSELSQYTTEQMEAVESWVVHVENGFAPAALAQQLQVPSLAETGLIPDTYVYGMPDGVTTDDAIAQLQSVEQVEYFYPLVPLSRDVKYLPNDEYFPQQWHLVNNGQVGTAGEDVNVQNVWDTYSGSGVVIGIVDSGIDETHPDLAPHYRQDLSYDFLNDIPGGAAQLIFDDHGTCVAGVAAAVGDNTEGVAGAAYNADIASLRLVSDPPSDDTQEANALGYLNDDIDIYNHSWGPVDGWDWMAGPGPLTLAALQTSAFAGRGGLGNVHMWAAGNGLMDRDNVNYDGYANSRYTIAVGAIGSRGTQSWFSEPGASMLITTQSEGIMGSYGDAGYDGIVTTDRQGFDGYNWFLTAGSSDMNDEDYTATFNGTSSSTPLASGVVALMLEANPGLTYRDVEHILVETARTNDPADGDWVTNGAGYDVNHKYGHGAIDAEAAVTAAETWTNVHREWGYLYGPIPVNQAIGDNEQWTFTVTIPDELIIEWVEVVVDITHTYRGDLDIELESPAGTVSVLAEQHNDFPEGYDDWSFTTARHWGETSNGDWKFIVTDDVPNDTGTLNSFYLNFYGTLGEAGFIEGEKFIDLNGNNQQDLGEQAGSGFVIFADGNGNGQLDPGEVSTTTRPDGTYQLVVEPDRPFTILEVPRPGYTQTFPVSGGYADVIVSDQEVVTKFDFGNDPDPFTISGRKWADLSGDGVWDDWETGMAGIEIYLDLNQNGRLDDGEPSTLTNLTGNYSITADLGPGTYTVAEVLIEGLEQTYPAGGTYRLAVNAGQSISGINFGNRPIPGGMKGVVRYDANADGAHDTAERGMAGVVVYIDLNNDGRLSINEPSVITGSDGAYRFDNLFPGEYTVRQTPNDTATQTYPADHAPWSVVVAPEQVTREVDFANHPEDDFGDAPGQYPTTKDDGGPVHKVLYGYHLGGYVDGESDGQPQSRAAGDVSGDDGVVFLTPLIPGQTAKIEVTLTQEGLMANRPEQGYLQAWIDFKGDGDWSDPGEQVLRNRRLTRGANMIEISVPSDAVAGTTYARFRLGLEANLSFVGPSVAGEVEDYEVVVQANSTQTVILGATADGEWIRSVVGPTGLLNEPWGDWDDLGPMTDVVTGDFTGDGETDVAGRDAIGRWFVNKSTPGGMVLEHWGRWSTMVNYLDVNTGDFNNDGKMDIVGRADHKGKWIVAYSNGSQFTTGFIGVWKMHIDYHDVMVADFSGDGIVDILGRTEKGDWRLGEMQNGRLVNKWVGKWRNGGDPDYHTNVMSGDFNNDNRLDVIGLDKTGKWLLGRNDGSQLVNEVWGVWSTTPPWRHTIAGDFIGDGNLDILGMDDDGRWTLAYNLPGQPGFVSVPYGRWNPNRTWEVLLVYDVDQDGHDDVLGLNDVGQWQLGRGGGQNGLETQIWGEWNSQEDWIDVALAQF